MLDLRVKLKKTKRENNEQKQIVEKLSTVQRYKKEIVEQKAKLKELFDSVLQRSMNGEMDSARIPQ